MKFRFIVAIAFSIGLMPNSSVAVKIDTEGTSEADFNSEMVLRCQYQNGEFGTEGLNVCVKAEREARAALMDYPDELEGIVNRCFRAMRLAGWNMVQKCADKDTAARDALEAYAAEHRDIVETCRHEYGRNGHDQVKRCADEQIAKLQGTAD